MTGAQSGLVKLVLWIPRDCYDSKRDPNHRWIPLKNCKRQTPSTDPFKNPKTSKHSMVLHIAGTVFFGGYHTFTSAAAPGKKATNFFRTLVVFHRNPSEKNISAVVKLGEFLPQILGVKIKTYLSCNLPAPSFSLMSKPRDIFLLKVLAATIHLSLSLMIWRF